MVKFMEHRVGHQTDTYAEVTQGSFNRHFSYDTRDKKATWARKLRGKDFGNLETIISSKSQGLTLIIFLLTLDHDHFPTLLKCDVFKILYPFFQGNTVTLLTRVRLGFTREST